MAEETTEQNDTAEPTQETSTEPTLEDLYKDLNVSEEAEQFTAQPKAPAPYTPDQNYDPDVYARQQQDALLGELNAVKSTLSQFQQQQLEQQMNADIQKAVDQIGTKVEGADPDIVEAMLNSEANKDPRFLKLFNQRAQNPRAWNKAVDAFANKVSDKFSVKTDPQLQENRRAATQSQSSMAGPNSSVPDDPFSGLTPGSKEWNEQIDKARSG